MIKNNYNHNNDSNKHTYEYMDQHYGMSINLCIYPERVVYACTYIIRVYSTIIKIIITICDCNKKNHLRKILQLVFGWFFL